MNRKFALAGLGVAAVSALTLFFIGCGGKATTEKKREITVISREESSGTRGAFDELMKLVVDGSNTLFREAVIVSSTDEAASKVEVDKHAIGYTSLGSVTPKVKALSIDGVAATEANVKNGTYNISRPFVLAARNGANSKIADDFIAFAASKNGQDVVSKAGYITVDDAAADYVAPGGLSGKITLSGSTSVEKVIEKLKEEYVKLNPNVKAEINYNGSAAGIKDCLAAKSDIAMSSRNLKAEEKGQLSGITFALDGIAVIVNQSNAVTDMALETVAKIFKGEMRYWNDL